jgi:hypothetical protein
MSAFGGKADIRVKDVATALRPLGTYRVGLADNNEFARLVEY